MFGSELYSPGSSTHMPTDWLTDARRQGAHQCTHQHQATRRPRFVNYLITRQSHTGPRTPPRCHCSQARLRHSMTHRSAINIIPGLNTQFESLDKCTGNLYSTTTCQLVLVSTDEESLWTVSSRNVHLMLSVCLSVCQSNVRSAQTSSTTRYLVWWLIALCPVNFSIHYHLWLEVIVDTFKSYLATCYKPSTFHSVVFS